MKKRRNNNEFRKKESERKKLYNKKYKILNSERVKQMFKKATAAYRQSNPEKVKKAHEKYRKSNPDKVRDSFKRATAIYRQSNPANVKNQHVIYRKSNPENVKKSYNKATATYRQLNVEKVAESSKNSSRIYKESYPERVQKIPKRKYLKRKLTTTENNTSSEVSEQKKLKNNCNDNSHETLQVQVTSPISIAKATELFNKNISVGPEYICTCCDQLWYRSSVTECNASSYKSCSREIYLCLTGFKSIDNTEWICGTCHSNLKAGKLPSCAKANKMSFPEKPDVLKDLTPRDLFHREYLSCKCVNCLMEDNLVFMGM